MRATPGLPLEPTVVVAGTQEVHLVAQLTRRLGTAAVGVQAQPLGTNKNPAAAGSECVLPSDSKLQQLPGVSCDE
jgi:hypothetical protein